MTCYKHCMATVSVLLRKISIGATKNYMPLISLLKLGTYVGEYCIGSEEPKCM